MQQYQPNCRIYATFLNGRCPGAPRSRSLALSCSGESPPGFRDRSCAQIMAQSVKRQGIGGMGCGCGWLRFGSGLRGVWLFMSFPSKSVRGVIAPC